MQLGRNCYLRLVCFDTYRQDHGEADPVGETEAIVVEFEKIRSVADEQVN